MAEWPDGTPLLGETTGFIMGRNKRREIQQSSFQHKRMFTEQNLFFAKKYFLALCTRVSCYWPIFKLSDTTDSVYCEVFWTFFWFLKLKKNFNRDPDRNADSWVRIWAKHCIIPFLERWVPFLGRCVDKLLARLLATTALWVWIQTSLKKQNGRHKQGSGQHTLARQKYTKNIPSKQD